MATQSKNDKNDHSSGCNLTRWHKSKFWVKDNTVVYVTNIAHAGRYRYIVQNDRWLSSEFVILFKCSFPSSLVEKQQGVMLIPLTDKAWVHRCRAASVGAWSLYYHPITHDKASKSIRALKGMCHISNIHLSIDAIFKKSHEVKP